MDSIEGYAIPLLLPKDFPVYYVENVGVINHFCDGFKKLILPTFNYYTGKDGGYVAIYKKGKKGALYSVGGDIYVVGQIRVKGNYFNRIFVPDGYALGDNITQDKDIIALCNEYFPKLKGSMWVGGDTGGWFGIQEDGSIYVCGQVISLKDNLALLEKIANENNGKILLVDNVVCDYIY